MAATSTPKIECRRGPAGRAGPVPRPQSQRSRALAGAAAPRACACSSWPPSWWRCGSSGSAARTTSSRPNSAKEVGLREDYKKKLAQAVNLEALKKQREQVQQYVTQLEKQLPSKAEMDALLSDINQAGLGRSLNFELFRPGQVSVKEYYAELPIAVRVTGRFHDVGSFAADIANLSRIVTLNNRHRATRQGRHPDSWMPPPKPSAIWMGTKSLRSARRPRERRKNECQDCIRGDCRFSVARRLQPVRAGRTAGLDERAARTDQAEGPADPGAQEIHAAGLYAGSRRPSRSAT